MSGLRQIRLVAIREMRERSRSRAFRISVVVMILGVVAAIVLPSMLESSGTKDIGLTGATPAELQTAIQAQGDAVGTTTRFHRYDTLAAGEDAVRHGDVDVLVVDAQRMEWRRRTDEQLRAVVTGAIQLVAVHARAAEAGINPDDLLALIAPVPVESVELGQVAGRSPDDETAAMLMTVVLFGAIATYGAMVLSGVVEEKASRVVEVLLARMPARNLLAGKIAGIGLLGLAQIAVTAVAALVAAATVDSVDIPAVRTAVVAWAVLWFVLGYALYATVFGALGSLASRTEDAQSVVGPVTVVLILGYFLSFAAIGSPDSDWARVVSLFPATAPFAMPNRIAMGATAWWEPVVASALTLAAIAGLVQLGGRVYTRAILHTGPVLKLRDVWRGAPVPAPGSTASPTRTRPAAGHIEGEIVINRPVEEVFDFVVDERNEPEYNPHMRRAQKLTEGPIDTGTRFRADIKVLGRTLPMDVHYTAVERPQRLVSSTHQSSMDVHGAMTFDPVPEGTRMRWAWDIEPRGLLKLTGPAAALIGRRQERAIWTGLKRLLEQRDELQHS